MPTTGSKRKATAAVKGQAKPNAGAATRKRGRVQRAALSNVANSNDPEASNAPKVSEPRLLPPETSEGRLTLSSSTVAWPSLS